MDHWKKKINEENEKLAKAEAAASDVQAEFEVRLDIDHVFTTLIPCQPCDRTGQQRRKNFVPVLKILAKPMSLSEISRQSRKHWRRERDGQCFLALLSQTRKTVLKLTLCSQTRSYCRRNDSRGE